MPKTLAGLPMDGGTVLREFQSPEGVTFDGESSGTAATSPLFSRLRAWESAKGKMVSQEVSSWNQAVECLQELEALGRMLGRCS